MNIRVLIAEPENELQDTYRDYLKGNGFEVESSTGGQDCIEKLQNWRPNVLVIEPDRADGYGEQILETARMSNTQIPVVVLSRRDGKALDFDVSEYHVKPYPMAKLVRSIRAAAKDFVTVNSRNRPHNELIR